MKIYDRNWMQVAAHLAGDDRVVLPLGSTEQHAYLFLGTDSILRISRPYSRDAALKITAP